MIPRAHLWVLVRIALGASALIILFFSGILPLEDLLTVSPQSLTASIAASDVASLTNEERIKNGLPPLSVSPLLAEAAQDKANDMAAHSYYAHTGPDGKTMLDWMNLVGYRYLNAGENLVIDRTTSEEAVDAWMHSPEHRENILRPQFTELGIGVAKGQYGGIDTIFVVQEFGTPYPNARVAALPQAPAPAKAAPVAAPRPAAPTTPVKPEVAAVAPAEPTAPFVPSAPLTLPSIPKPAIVPRIASLSAPAPLAPAKTAPAAPSSAALPAASTTAGQGTSTLNFALAPEFYNPVTLTDAEDKADEAQPAAPQGRSVSALSVLFAKVKAFIGEIF